MKILQGVLFLSLSLIVVLGLKNSINDQMHQIGGELGASITQLVSKPVTKIEEARVKIEELQLENHLLKEMVSQLKEDQMSDRVFSHQIERLLEMKEISLKETTLAQSFARQFKDLAHRINHQMRFIRAKIIFREPGTWGSYCWIDRGYASREGVLAINSPVVLGENLVGVIDFVGKNKSRVQLITDSRLPVSVQVTRGAESNLLLLRYLSRLQEGLVHLSQLSIDARQQQQFFDLIDQIKKELSKSVGDRYFAKGELFGSSFSLFRKKKNILRGIGFNCDFGQTEELKLEEQSIQLGDLLVTTGFDGVFPKGLHVAIVSSIDPVNEGDIATNIAAMTTIPNLGEIQYVEVLPPIKQEEDFKIPE